MKSNTLTYVNIYALKPEWCPCREAASASLFIAASCWLEFTPVQTFCVWRQILRHELYCRMLCNSKKVSATATRVRLIKNVEVLPH